MISDFPNEAHLIGSLDIHPQDWAILSRNLSRDENSEWTCVHNIQDYEKPNEMIYIEKPKTDNIYFPYAMFRASTSSDQQSDSLDSNSNSQDNNELVLENVNRSSNDDQQTTRVPVNSGSLTVNDEQQTNPNDLHISPLIIISARSSSRRAQATLLNPNTSYRQIKPDTNPLPKIFCNLDRMSHYIDESNDYKLFFKESHFSSCGRFIASPYENGFRLFSFNAECTELSDQMMSSQFRRPQKLNEIKSFMNHSNYVTTVNFSPTHHLIVSGCLNGQINFYQPVL